MLDTTSAVTALFAVLDAVAFLYGAYWALEIGKALRSPLYGKQALWVGAIGVYFAAFFLLSALALALGLPGFGSNTATDVAVGAFLYIGVIMFFVWIDSTIKVARRSDPLRRNTLRWSKLRWFLGIFVVVGTFFALAFNIGTAVDFAHATPLYGPIGGVLFFGAIALLLSAKRSGDTVLKRHLKWFGLFAVLLWATSGVEGTSVFRSSANDPFILAVSYVVFAAAAYFLYKSARSLAPIAQLPPATA